MTELEFEESEKAELLDSTIELRLFRLATERFALLAKEVADVTSWRHPVPLPGAPEAILGIVAVQGRMITVLDTAKILGDARTEELVNPDFVIVLVGQEQLGLTATSEGVALEISLSDIEVALNTEGRPLLGYVRQEGENVQILDPLQLFAAAIRGKERRRRQR